MGWNLIDHHPRGSQRPLMHLLRNAFDHGIEDPATRQARGKSEQGVIEQLTRVTDAYYSQ